MNEQMERRRRKNSFVDGERDRSNNGTIFSLGFLVLFYRKENTLGSIMFALAARGMKRSENRRHQTSLKPPRSLLTRPSQMERRI